MNDDDLLIFEQVAAFRRDNDRRIAEQMEKLATDHALLHRAAEMLKSFEWSHPGNGDNRLCPVCFKFHSQGHKPDCALAALIRELESRLAL